MKNRIKIILLAISAIVLSQAAMAQTWSGSGFPTGDAYRTGKVGIGTNSPAAKLQVYEETILGTTIGNYQIISSTGGRPDNTSSGYNKLFNNTWLIRSEAGNDWWKAKFHDGISLENGNLTPGTDTKTWWERHPFADRQTWGSAGTPYMSLSQGRLGIGIYDPAARLDLEESNNSFSTFIARNRHTTGGGYCILSNVKLDQTKALAVVNSNTGWVEPFVVYGNGQTRIGVKSSTAHPNAMLTVDGKIVCKDLYVTATSDWPDFVFEKNYQLASLSDVRAYYEANKHLPNVPTACEIEEKGINMSEMSAIQMQKIEELTIYIVQLKEELDRLKKTINNTLNIIDNEKNN